MSTHDEELLQQRNRKLVQALKDVLEVVESVPENLRVQAGLYSIAAFNIAYALIEQEDRRLQRRLDVVAQPRRKA